MTKTLREGEDSAVPTDILTAPTAVSHAEHSPLPWRVFDEDFPNHHFPGIEAPEYSVVIWGHESEGQGVRGRTADEARANAAFIVRACNHHEALLVALKTLVDAYEDPRLDDPHALVVAAKDVIDNVEGN